MTSPRVSSTKLDFVVFSASLGTQYVSHPTFELLRGLSVSDKVAGPGCGRDRVHHCHWSPLWSAVGERIYAGNLGNTVVTP